MYIYIMPMKHTYTAVRGEVDSLSPAAGSMLGGVKARSLAGTA